MKVRKPTTHLVEIGPLIGRMRLPMEGRLRRGLKTTCSVCGTAITDDFFIGGFIQGHPNVLLHEGCAPPE